MRTIAKYRDEMRVLLKSIFDPALNWGENQIKSYELLKHYLNTFRLKYLASNQSRDKFVIMDNLKGQSWYKQEGTSVNSILTSLIDQMTITREESMNTDLTKVLNLVIDFKHFKLQCYYYQQVGELISLQIFLSFDGDVKQRNYLAYNIKGSITVIPVEIQEKMGVPELYDLNDQTKINKSMISAEALMSFFLEIILYYDETETIGELKLSEASSQTINEILSDGLDC